MTKYITKKRVAAVGICCFIAVAMGLQAVSAAEKLAGYEEGLKHYENNETDKATELFKKALATSFAEPTSGKLKEAVELAKSGKTKEAEDILLSLFDAEATAARARYELGLIYESKGNTDGAVTMLKNAATIIADNGAAYVGVKACKMCHLKQHKTWKVTKMAKAFEVLKPGVRTEAKAKFKLDPQKDYTKDPKCLECHTTGFGLPGGYKIPEPGDTKAAKRAKDNAGITCEACHGPGSKFKVFHKETMSKKREYTQDELYQLGQHKINVKVCTTCHNRRNPTAEPSYHFDYEKHKAKDTHDNFPLKYRAKE